MNSAIGYSEGAEVPEDKTTDNELIAEFMGFQPTETHNIHGTVYSHHDFMGVYGGKAQEFKYHKSWDWLVPVARKFTEKAKHTDMPHAIFMNVYTFSVCRPIGELYENIIKGIKWYNQQKLKTRT